MLNQRLRRWFNIETALYHIEWAVVVRSLGDKSEAKLLVYSQFY